jgi:hypothetical protein
MKVSLVSYRLLHSTNHSPDTEPILVSNAALALIIYQLSFISLCVVMWVPVNTTWRVLKLRKKEKTSVYGERLRIHFISSGEQPTMGGPPAWGLGEGLTTPHPKKAACCKIRGCIQKFSDWQPGARTASGTVLCH